MTWAILVTAIVLASVMGAFGLRWLQLRKCRPYTCFAQWQRTIADWFGCGPEEIFQFRGWNDWRGKLWCALHFGVRHEYGANHWYYPGPDCCINCGKVAPYEQKRRHRKRLRVDRRVLPFLVAAVLTALALQAPAKAQSLSMTLENQVSPAINELMRVVNETVLQYSDVEGAPDAEGLSRNFGADKPESPPVPNPKRCWR